jgi:hypothetical protein
MQEPASTAEVLELNFTPPAPRRFGDDSQMLGRLSRFLKRIAKRSHCGGQGFESPQLHQEVRANRRDFLVRRIARHSRDLRRRTSRASATASSSPATRPSPSRGRMPTPRRSARNLACAMCSKARSSATRVAFASTRSSSTRNPERICGPTAVDATIPSVPLFEDHDPLDSALPFSDQQSSGLETDALARSRSAGRKGTSALRVEIPVTPFA